MEEMEDTFGEKYSSLAAKATRTLPDVDALRKVEERRQLHPSSSGDGVPAADCPAAGAGQELGQECSRVLAATTAGRGLPAGSTPRRQLSTPTPSISGSVLSRVAVQYCILYCRYHTPAQTQEGLS